MGVINIAVIGAGVVGLAVAARMSEENEGVYIFEKNEKFGQETSGHNSGVIHSGIHYPPGTLKAKLSVEGNTLLYEICEKNQIPHKRLGKLTVALKNEDEMKELEHLMRQGKANGVPGLEFMDRDKVENLEPNVQVEKALYSPSTGIIEPDGLMNYFYAEARRNNVFLTTLTEVKEIRKIKEGYEIAGTSAGENFRVTTETVINCAGLHSDKVAAMVGLDVDKLGYRLHLCKGDYYRLSGPPLVKTLVYPLPKGGGLGIHLTPDMAGSIRLGPNAYYVDTVDYAVMSDEKEFREDVARFMPMIQQRKIGPDSAGVRPKLQGPQDGFKDFVIRHEVDRGLPGFVNLIGIESPGLTAAPAIARLVAEMYRKEIKQSR